MEEDEEREEEESGGAVGVESGGKAGGGSGRRSASARRGDRMGGRPAEPRGGSYPAEPPGRESVLRSSHRVPSLCTRVLSAQRDYTTCPRWQGGNRSHRRGFHSCP